MRAWFACTFLFVVAAFEIVLDAPRDLTLATVVAFLLCAALLALHMMRHIGYRTYDIVRFVIVGGVFGFVFTRPYPFHWLVAVFLAIMIPLNLVYPDRTPGDSG